MLMFRLGGVILQMLQASGGGWMDSRDRPMQAGSEAEIKCTVWC